MEVRNDYSGIQPFLVTAQFVEATLQAYNTNPQLLAERANISATDEGVPQALAGWRPTVRCMI